MISAADNTSFNQVMHRTLHACSNPHYSSICVGERCHVDRTVLPAQNSLYCSVHLQGLTTLWFIDGPHVHCIVQHVPFVFAMVESTSKMGSCMSNRVNHHLMISICIQLTRLKSVLGSIFIFCGGVWMRMDLEYRLISLQGFFISSSPCKRCPLVTTSLKKPIPAKGG